MYFKTLLVNHIKVVQIFAYLIVIHYIQCSVYPYILNTNTFCCRYKDTSPEVAETARALATAYSNVGDETAESKI